MSVQIPTQYRRNTDVLQMQFFMQFWDALNIVIPPRAAHVARQ
jgi:hypothetical protein